MSANICAGRWLSHRVRLSLLKEVKEGRGKAASSDVSAGLGAGRTPAGPSRNAPAFRVLGGESANLRFAQIAAAFRGP